MKHGIYYAYWEQEWAADYKRYVEKVAGLLCAGGKGTEKMR